MVLFVAEWVKVVIYHRPTISIVILGGIPVRPVVDICILFHCDFGMLVFVGPSMGLRGLGLRAMLSHEPKKTYNCGLCFYIAGYAGMSISRC